MAAVSWISGPEKAVSVPRTVEPGWCGPVTLSGGGLQFTATAGFSAAYYNVVNNGYVADFSGLTPVATRVDATIDFPDDASGFEPGVAGLNTTNCGAVWTGQLNVTSGGTYTFQNSSDDGSLLFVDGQQVVDDDGPHGMQTVAGTIYLAPGAHQVTVEYAQSGGGAGIIAQYSGPDTQGAMVDIGANLPSPSGGGAGGEGGAVTSGGTLNLANPLTVTADSSLQLPAAGGTATIASLAIGGQTLDILVQAPRRRWRLPDPLP